MASRARKPARPPPRTVEPEPDICAIAEATVPAAAMLVKGFWEHVGALPDPDHFDDVNLGALLTAIIAVHKRTQVTKFAVAAELREMGWDDAAAFRAMAPARPDLLTLPEALAAVEALHTRKLRRQVAQVCGETLKELTFAQDVLVTVQRHERAIIDLASQSDGADDFKRGEDVKEEKFDRVQTGIRELDEVSGGLPCGTLTFLGGRPGMGKTALAVTLLRNVAKRGHAAAINSLEMPSTSLINRAAAAEAYDERFDDNVKYADYERRALEGEMLERFEAARTRIRRLPIWWDDKEGRTAPQIRMGGRRLKTTTGRAGFDLRLLVVDHLGHVKPHTSRDNRTVELGDISGELLATAKELKIPVVVLAQLNRELEKRPDKRPNIWDLRESGRLEEDGHTVLLLYRQEHYDTIARQRGEDVDEEKERDNKNIVEVDFAKNRGGVLKRIRLFCDIACNAIMDRSVGFATKMRPIQEGLFT